MTSNTLTNQYYDTRKYILHYREWPCYILLLSLFFPTRGAMLGLVKYYMVIIFSLLWFLITIKVVKMSYKVPPLLIFYLLTVVVMDLHNFTASHWWAYFNDLVPVVLAILFIPNRINTKEALIRFLKFIAVVFTVYSMFCIIESISGFNIFDSLTYTKIEEYTFVNEIRFGFYRNRGALDISINNGMLLTLVLCLVAYLITVTKKKGFIFSYIVIFAAAFLSLSRGVWIMIVISQLLIFFKASQKNKIKIILLSVLTIFCVFLIGTMAKDGFVSNFGDMLSNMIRSITDIFTGNDSANMIDMGHRFVLWDWTFYTVGDKFLLGFGAGAPVEIMSRAGYLKLSCEVMLLARYYYGGIVAFIGFALLEVWSIVYPLINIKHNHFKKVALDFNYYLFAGGFAYAIALLAAAGSEELRLFYIFFTLAIAFNNIVKTNKIQNSLCNETSLLR